MPRQRIPYFSFFFNEAHHFISKNLKVTSDDCFTLGAREKGDYYLKTFWQYWETEKHSKEPTIFWPLVKLQWPLLTLCVVLQFLVIALYFASPILFTYLYDFVYDSNQPIWVGILYGVGILVGNALRGYLRTQYEWQCHMFEIRTMALIQLLIYSCAISSKKELSIGQMSNYMNTDSYNIEHVSQLIVAFCTPIQLLVFVALLGWEIGWMSVFPVIVFVGLIPFYAYFETKYDFYYDVVKRKSDERVSLTIELFNGIRMIKLNSIEEPILNRILLIRKKEAMYRRRIAILTAVSSWLASMMPILILILTYISMGLVYQQNFTLTIAFLALGYIFSLYPTFFAIQTIVYAGPNVLNSITRITSLLLLEEIEDYVVKQEIVENPSIIVEQGDFAWVSEKATDFKLTNLNLDIRGPGLKMIVGKVGSGKSSVFHALLGNIPKVSAGSVAISGRVSYVPQIPWIFSASIRENILFGKEFKEDLYAKVIAVSELTEDLNQLPNSDATQIGARGINLSGGQKQRVSIARALYQEADIYLLDDVLSALDPEVQMSVFKRCFLGYLSAKIVLFSANQLHLIPFCDRLVFVEKGVCSELLPYQEMRDRDEKFMQLMDRFVVASEKHDDHEEVEHQLFDEKQAVEGDSLQTTEGINTTAKGLSYVLWMYSKTGLPAFLFMIFFFVIDIGLNIASSFWLSIWGDSVTLQDVPGAATLTQSNIMNAIVGTVQYQYQTHTLIYFLLIYILMLLIASVANFIAFFFIYGWMMDKFSESVHKKMMTALLSTKVSFYDRTPIGRVIRRITDDLSQMQFVILGYSFIIYSALEIIGIYVIIGIVAWPIFLAIFPTIFLFAFLVWYCHHSQVILYQVKAQDAQLATNFLTLTGDGLDVIRSSRAENTFIQQFIEISGIYFCSLSSVRYINRWLLLRFRIIAAFMQFLIVLGVILIRAYYPAFLTLSQIGVAFSYSIVLVEKIADIEGVLVLAHCDEFNYVYRCREVFHKKTAARREVLNFGKRRANVVWPRSGNLIFKNVNFKYQTGPLVLKDINFVIQHGEKVGIVGRTGSGKSTLMQALFRIEELADGQIIVDGIDIGQVDIVTARRAFTIIPQDPFIFAGTLRFNIDPFDAYSDADVMEMLDYIGMTEFLANKPDGLSFQIETGGSNLSIGERQLVCIARALIKQNIQFLLLDEATANIDTETDEMLQKVIKLRECTVIVIAHRVNTIIHSDKILVIDKGTVKEFDSPRNLIMNSTSSFFKMVMATGTSSAKALMKEAGLSRQEVSDCMEKGKLLLLTAKEEKAFGSNRKSMGVQGEEI